MHVKGSLRKRGITGSCNVCKGQFEKKKEDSQVAVMHVKDSLRRKERTHRWL